MGGAVVALGAAVVVLVGCGGGSAGSGADGGATEVPIAQHMMQPVDLQGIEGINAPKLLERPAPVAADNPLLTTLPKDLRGKVTEALAAPPNPTSGDLATFVVALADETAATAVVPAYDKLMSTGTTTHVYNVPGVPGGAVYESTSPSMVQGQFRQGRFLHIISIVAGAADDHAADDLRDTIAGVLQNWYGRIMSATSTTAGE